MSRFYSTANGTADALGSVGQVAFGHLYQHPGTLPLIHPAVSIFRKTSQRAFRSEYISATNGTPAPGGEVEFEVRSCDGYLVGAAFDVVLPLITGRPDPASVTDNAVWMDDVGYGMIEWCEVHFGSCSDKPREYGTLWQILHNHLEDGNQYNENIFNLPFNDRVAACTRPVPLHTPLMFDFLLHPTKALFMPNHLSTPLAFRARLRPNADLVERIGTAEFTGLPGRTGDPHVPVQAIFPVVPESYDSFRLRLDYMHLNQQDTQAARSMGARHLVLRFHERISKTVTGALSQLRFDLTANRTVDRLWIVPNVTDNQVGRSFGANFLDHRGPDVASLHPAASTAWVWGDAFSGATFEINNNPLLSERFTYLIDGSKARGLPHNPRDQADQVPAMLLDPYAVHHAGATLHLGKQVGRYLDIHFGEFDSVPGHGAWDGTIEVFYSTVRVLREHAGAAVLSN